MEAHEAIELLELLQANYQGTDLTGTAGALWTSELMQWEVEDMAPAVLEVCRTREFLSLAAVLELCVEHKMQRLDMDLRQREKLALEDAVAATPERVMSILADYWAKLGLEERGSSGLRRAAAGGDVEAKIEAGRQLAQAQIAGEAWHGDEGAERPPKRGEDARVMTTACGARAGVPAAWDGGRRMWVCPKCGCPVKEGCDGPANKAARERATS